MKTPSAKMASTLRLFTRGGREETFSTTLVEDLYSRHLRALVAAGYLTMDYTGTRRVYALTPAGRAYLEGKGMSKKKQAEPKPPPRTSEPAEKPSAPRKERAPRRPATEEPPTLEPRRKARGNAAPPQGAVVSPLDVIRLMREVRDYADAHEGVEGLLALIRRVEDIGRRFGGLDYVRESLEAIQEFRGESTPRQ